MPGSEVEDTEVVPADDLLLLAGLAPTVERGAGAIVRHGDPALVAGHALQLLVARGVDRIDERAAVLVPGPASGKFWFCLRDGCSVHSKNIYEFLPDDNEQKIIIIMLKNRYTTNSFKILIAKRISSDGAYL